MQLNCTRSETYLTNMALLNPKSTMPGNQSQSIRAFQIPKRRKTTCQMFIFPINKLQKDLYRERQRKCTMREKDRESELANQENASSNSSISFFQCFALLCTADWRVQKKTEFEKFQIKQRNMTPCSKAHSRFSMTHRHIGIRFIHFTSLTCIIWLNLIVRSVERVYGGWCHMENILSNKGEGVGSPLEQLLRNQVSSFFISKHCQITFLPSYGESYSNARACKREIRYG